MDCDIHGTLWSDVNTHVVVSKSERGLWCNNGEWEGTSADVYGDIYCSKYLFIDLIWARDIAKIASADRFSYQANWIDPKFESKHDWIDGYSEYYDTQESKYYFDNKYAWAARNNAIKVGDVYAERLQIHTNQSKVDDGAVSEFGYIYVGTGGYYIDGNDNNNIHMSYLYNETKTNEKYEWNTKKSANTVKQDENWKGSVSSTVSGKLADVWGEFGANKKPLDHKEAVFGSANDAIWRNKLITIRSWSAPAHSEKTADLEGGKAIDYVGGAMGGITVANYIAPETNPDYSNALSVSGTTLTIKESVWFKGDAEGKIDLSAFDKIVLDTSGGNIHIKFDGDVVIGKADAASYHGTANDGLADGTNVVLTGGNMTFWYLYEGKGYDMNNPTLKLNPYTQIGLVQASGNVGRAYDGLYIVSNDNAFTYAPHGQLFMEPGSAGGANTMNGCMAIESLVLLSDADADDSTWLDKIEDWWHGATGGQVGDDIEDAIVGQYQESNYHYVQPPLIVDFGFSYGDIESEIQDYGQVIWAFLGYY